VLCIEKIGTVMDESDYVKKNIELIQNIKQMPSLELFEDKDINVLLRLSEAIKYKPGEMILEEGGQDKLLYFLVSGRVNIIKNGEDLAVLQRNGDIFGEMGIIDGSARSASAYALDETICLTIDISNIDRFSGNDRITICYILYRVFSEFLANRLRHTSEELIDVKEEIERLRKLAMYDRW